MPRIWEAQLCKIYVWRAGMDLLHGCVGPYGLEKLRIYKQSGFPKDLGEGIVSFIHP